MRIFIRQCLTETRTPEARDLIQEVLDCLSGAAAQCGHRVRFGPGDQATRARYDGDFRQRFEEETGQEFTPRNFDQWRDRSLREADIFVAVRTAMSESTALEIGRFTTLHPDPWERCFLLLADTPEAEIRTTLLRSAIILPFATRAEGPGRRLVDPAALQAAILERILEPSLARLGR